MPRSIPAAVLLAGAATLGLAACTTDTATSGSTVAAPAAAPATAHPSLPAVNGVVRHGDSFAMMSEQYAPRAGPYAATGASAWVRPAPAPAFVATGPLPPANPPAPAPAAVANRQPAAPAPAAAAASEVVRPEAATPESSAPARDPAVRTAGLALFNANTCGACHAFADAGASGGIGPSLDSKLAVRTVVNILTNGQGAMPSFGQLSETEMLALANYLNQYSR